MYKQVVAMGIMWVAGAGFVIADQQILDDLIVDGSLAVGQDAVNGEDFGFDTIRLKENNLRIHFSDTSTSGSFPSTDWRIVINDSSNGGDNYFAIEDADAGQLVFRVDAGAPANALKVDGEGDVGIGLENPVLELHVAGGDTPGLRLEQDGTEGWTPQAWDLAGNEDNFFIRDVTHASAIPFRIQPGAPDNALTVKASGKTGIGTWNPQAKLHVEASVNEVGALLVGPATVVPTTTLHVEGNRASRHGGGAYLLDGGTLLNCTLSGNEALEDGGGALLVRGGKLVNCTLSGNSAGGTAGGAMLYEGGSLNNSIVWNNSSAGDRQDVYDATGAGTVRYTCASDGVTNGVNGCITSSPAFVSANDFRLTADSPCINAGSNDLVQVSTDLAGNPRLVGASVDLGAYERQLVIDQNGPLAVAMSEDGHPTAWAAPALSASAGNAHAVLSWSVSGEATRGTATVAGTGNSPSTFIYAPDANVNGSDSFTVQVTDGSDTNTIAVHVTIDPVVDPADVTLGALAHTYDGTAHAAIATTSPTNLTVELTYDGGALAPTNAGRYQVVATVVDPVYSG
ncbi:MBG domain-containing protein, partial [Pontiella sp.]|uniref:MBG domain-containing protein n=1 Tax=Pontiella sp. TaxID=2837462 RepID=UPI0035644B2B